MLKEIEFKIGNKYHSKEHERDLIVVYRNYQYQSTYMLVAGWDYKTNKALLFMAFLDSPFPSDCYKGWLNE